MRGLLSAETSDIKRQELVTMSSWFVRPKASPAATLRLFCLPFAGVGPSAFRGWADAFGPYVDVVIAQLPGREGRLREKPLTSVGEIVSGICAAMAPMLDRPYAVCGHSLGGLIGFELVRALGDGGFPAPMRLFVSASRAPHLPNPHPPLRHLDDLALLQQIDRRYAGSVPRAVMESADLRDLFVPALRADLTALETYRYRPGPPLDCGISVFGGTNDRTIPADALEGWRQHTKGLCRLRAVDGGHLFLQSAARLLVDAMRSDLLTLELLSAGDLG